MSRRLVSCVVSVICVSLAWAEPLSKKVDVDFFRDVPSRNLKGMATRSDGRLVGGPTLTDSIGTAPADLLWCIEPTGDPHRFLIGTGADGRIVEVKLDPVTASYETRTVVKLDDPQVFAVKRLPDGSIIAGTSPKGALYLVRDGKPVARVHLPVDSIFDLLAIDEHTVLVSTGNPGRIFRVDVRKFSTVGLIADKITDAKILADRGITLFGEIRDRNVRRLAAFPDGRVIAGSSPKGNVYAFPPAGGAAVVLQENREAEVTDLLPQANGDLYATIVFSATAGETRITPATTRAAGKERDTDAALPPVQVDKFGGRSALVHFPANGFAETLASRSGAAFYRLARFGDTLVIAGGDAGELLGYDLKARLSLTFAGSTSAQVNGIAALPSAPGRFLLLRNNTPGLALLDFNHTGAREAETRRIDLATPAVIGAVRFNRLRNIDPAVVSIEARANNGSDEVEGWGPWTRLTLDPDGGWRAPNLRGRSVKLRLRLPAAANAQSFNPAQPVEFDRAAIHALPQNRRPQLQEFRVLSPNFGLIPNVDSPPSPIVSLSQILQPSSRDEEKRKGGFTSSQVVPQPGAQVVYWTVSDPDGDNVACTFSLRREGDEQWIDVVTATRETYAQFDVGHLPEGVYFTRLVATEIAPRHAPDRLSHTFETDDMIVDHTPPELVETGARRDGDSVIVTVRGRDRLSLIEGAEFVFSNGVREVVEQPSDGIRDGRDETFTLDVPLARISNATSVEVTLYDASGNSVAKRMTWSQKPAN